MKTERGPKIPLREAAQIAQRGTFKHRVSAQRKRLQKKYPGVKITKASGQAKDGE